MRVRKRRDRRGPRCDHPRRRFDLRRTPAIVSCVDAVFGGLLRTDKAWYVVAQVVGAAIGVLLANLLFGLPAVNISTQVRSGPVLWLGEIVATLGLLLAVFGLVRSRNTQVARFAGGADFFTSSSSFATVSSDVPLDKQRRRT
jgi:glycerol uptake facilitator-like aquaporin